jgi:hypothetical protein
MAKKICTTLLGLGRGISAQGEASADTLRRADTLGQYHQAHSRKIGLIVCSGAYTKSMPVPPPASKTEGLAMADRLVRKWGVPARKVAVEDEAQDTFFNLIYSVEDGLFDDAVIDDEHPIGLGVGILHGIRARLITRQALGVSGRAVQIINAEGELSLTGGVVELGGAALTAWVLRGAEPGNIQDTRDAAESFENMMGWARSLPMFSGVQPQAETE